MQVKYTLFIISLLSINLFASEQPENSTEENEKLAPVSEELLSQAIRASTFSNAMDFLSLHDARQLAVTSKAMMKAIGNSKHRFNSLALSAQPLAIKHSKTERGLPRQELLFPDQKKMIIYTDREIEKFDTITGNRETSTYTANLIMPCGSNTDKNCEIFLHNEIVIIPHNISHPFQKPKIIQFWNHKSGKEISKITTYGYRLTKTVPPTRVSLITLGEEKNSTPQILKRWDPNTGKLINIEPNHPFDLFGNRAFSFSLEDQQQKVAVICSDNAIRAFNSKDQGFSFTIQHDTPIKVMGSLTNGNMFFVDLNGKVVIYNVDTKEQKASLENCINCKTRPFESPCKIYSHFSNGCLKISKLHYKNYCGNIWPAKTSRGGLCLISVETEEDGSVTLSKTNPHVLKLDSYFQRLSNNDGVKICWFHSRPHLSLLNTNTKERIITLPFKLTTAIKRPTVTVLRDDRVMVRDDSLFVIFKTPSYFQRKAAEEAAARQSKKIEETEGGSK